MPDWTKSMQQTFEYYIVDPATWMDLKQLTNVKSCTIDWDSSSDTLVSATIEIDGTLDENYVRVYLITIQNGVTEKHALGTFLVQTPSDSFDGKVSSESLDAYSPLLELKEKKPEIGYYVPENNNVMDNVYTITRGNLRAPVIKPSCDEELYDDFVTNPDDTWLANLKDLMANAKYNFMLNEMGHILFSPKQEFDALQPVTTYDDGNSSILYPDLDIDRDLYGIPNVVEVIYSDGTDYNSSTGKGGTYRVVIKNEDPNSPTSIPRRGREIYYRETNPSLVGNPTEEQIEKSLNEYANKLLKDLSSKEYQITYTHGYYPSRIGDCVRLNYTRAGLNNVKARIISQSIQCVPGCPVTEVAVYTTKLWR